MVESDPSGSQQEVIVEEEIYTVTEVATKLKITRKGVYDLMRDGRLRYVQIGLRQRRITNSALREFLQLRERGLAGDVKTDYNPGESKSLTPAGAFH
jgi:excisionase family DNA binding protein